MNPFWEVADFIRETRRRLRFGELSRSPLELLRVEWHGGWVECDWMARPADVWDASLRRIDRDRHVSEQALRDGIQLREALFSELPGVREAQLRGFRPAGAREPPELVIAGIVTRETAPLYRVNSLVMRAKLCGLQFDLEDGVLKAMEGVESAVSRPEGAGYGLTRNAVHLNEMTLQGQGGVS